MSLNDTLSNVLSQVLNCEKVGKKSCNTKNSSKLIKDVLSILKEKKYILDFEVKETSKGEELKVLLSGNINIPLIFDDPFHNFDDVRLEKTISAVKELSKNKKIILISHKKYQKDYKDFADNVIELK